jgi:FkbM family methyltransferase
MRSIIGRLQKSLSRNRIARACALSLRNQANCILGCYLGETADQHFNGEELVARHFAPHCRTFVDVGANVGSWTKMWLCFAPSNSRGVLFEPLPDMQSQLLRLVEGKDTLSLVGMAVGDQEATMPLAIDQTFSETSSLAGHLQDHSITYHETKVCTLDGTLPEYGFTQVDFLKIDAEGFDGRVLKGASHLLTNQAIRTVQFEYNSMWAAAGSTLTEVTAWLGRLGYHVFLVKSDGLHTLDLAAIGEFYRYSNFLAVSDQTIALAREIAVDSR